MSRFTNTQTGVVVSVDDSKDDRFNSELWESAGDEPKQKRTAKKPAAKSDEPDSDDS